MHRLEPFLSVGLDNFLIRGLQKELERQWKKKTDSIKLGIRKSINLVETKLAVLHVWVRNTQYYYWAFFNNNLNDMKKTLPGINGLLNHCKRKRKFVGKLKDADK